VLPRWPPSFLKPRTISNSSMNEFLLMNFIFLWSPDSVSGLFMDYSSFVASLLSPSLFLCLSPTTVYLLSSSMRKQLGTQFPPKFCFNI
jgi:hypothetical protein